MNYTKKHFTAVLALAIALITSAHISAMETEQQYAKSQDIITEQSKNRDELVIRVNNLEKAMGTAQAMIQELKDSFDQKISRLKQSISSTQEIISNTDEKLNMLASQVDRMSLSGSQ